MAAIPFNFYNTFRSAAIRPKSPKEFFLLASSNGLAKRHSRGLRRGQLTLISRFATILRGDEPCCVHTPSLQASFPYLPPSIPSPLTGHKPDGDIHDDFRAPRNF